ncbi:hypothetical protein BY458DRAFT_490583 [Sporodiniella umbellata]|nr:hypothetical protein BY458DRAFT_490583 [Sporodiniella umbellata]
MYLENEVVICNNKLIWSIYFLLCYANVCNLIVDVCHLSERGTTEPRDFRIISNEQSQDLISNTCQVEMTFKFLPATNTTNLSLLRDNDPLLINYWCNPTPTLLGFCVSSGSNSRLPFVYVAKKTSNFGHIFTVVRCYGY